MPKIVIEAGYLLTNKASFSRLRLGQFSEFEVRLYQNASISAQSLGVGLLLSIEIPLYDADVTIAVVTALAATVADIKALEIALS